MAGSNMLKWQKIKAYGFNFPMDTDFGNVL